MSALPAQPKWHSEEYLSWERQQPTKHELIDNYIMAMTGASRKHNIIASNINGIFYNQLRKKPCETYMSDMRVQVKESGTFTYPDIVVVCGEPQFNDDAYLDTLTNPTVILKFCHPQQKLLIVQLN